MTKLAPILPDALLTLAMVENHSAREMSVPLAGVACGDGRAKRWNAALAPKIGQSLAKGRWKTYAEDNRLDAHFMPVSQIEPRSLVLEAHEYGFGLLVCAVPCGAPAKRRRLVLHGAFDRPYRAPLPVVQVAMTHLAELAALAIPEDVHYGMLVTNREEAVVGLLMQGLTVPAISKRLGRSPHTIHDHIKSLHAKTGVSTRGELVARALGHLPRSVPSVPKSRRGRAT